MIARLNGFSEEQVLDIRSGAAPFNLKYNALAGLVKSFVENFGKPSAGLVEKFFSSGYTKENLVDTIVLIGDKIITNYLHGVTKVPIDFPTVPALENQTAQ
jgi:hypothetical protein